MTRILGSAEVNFNSSTVFEHLDKQMLTNRYDWYLLFK